jgi:hypothetical protein
MSDTAFPKGDREAHARLARGMVRRTGVDLGERVADDRVTDDALGSILDRCCQCAYPGSCASWQADHADGAAEAPAYCLNRDLFAGLPHTG